MPCHPTDNKRPHTWRTLRSAARWLGAAATAVCAAAAFAASASVSAQPSGTAHAAGHQTKPIIKASTRSTGKPALRKRPLAKAPAKPRLSARQRAAAVAAAAGGAAAVSAGSIDAIKLNSNAALVVDQGTREVLLSKNDKAVLPIASLTKLMTGMVIDDAQLPMDEVITITEDDIDTVKGSGSRLAVGTRLTRGEAMHLALMSSENRAAHALGRTFPEGLGAFVQRMNLKAAELGMRDTRYVEPTGLSSDNRSSARDLAALVAAASQRPLLRELSTSPSYEIAAGRRVLQYRNSNRLIENPDWSIGLQKTGYIAEAGRCLVMQAQVAGRQIIMVFLDAAGKAARLGDAERVRRWVEHTLAVRSAGV